MNYKVMIIAIAIAAVAAPLWGDILVKSNEKVVFLGDSITSNGWKYRPNGFIHLVEDGLREAGVKIIPIPRGVSGNKSNNMLCRFQNDVLRQAPAWVLISCGVNDVWHGSRGVKLEDYKKNMIAMIDMAQKNNIKVMLLTPTMIKEDREGKLNKQLSQYNNFLKKLAKERKLVLADLNADMMKIVASPDVKLNRWKRKLTIDGVHMAREGNQMMARGILKAFGVENDKITEIQKQWETYPDSTRISFDLSVPQWEMVDEAAKKAGIPVHIYVCNMALKAAAKTK